ncbi:MAG: dUTP diphosphatase [Patescibacteria group bacterium]
MILRIKKLDPAAKLPSRAHEYDAGLDLYALEKTILKSGERKAVRTGIALEIPEGYVGLIWDKSGIAIKEGIKTLGGVVDAGYRGEVLVGTINLSAEEYVFEAGHKVAQILIQKVEQMEIEEVSELTDTTRGQGGFGSTGK